MLVTEFVAFKLRLCRQLIKTVILVFNICICFTETLLNLLGVGILWGATNPFLKKTSEGIENIKADSAFSQFINEIIFLFTNWKVTIIFVTLD